MHSQFKIELKKLNIQEDTKIFLAISGGMDSMLLTHLLYQFNIEHTLLHCNFNLRGKESDEDEEFLKKYATSKQIKIETISFNTKNVSINKKLSIQECARNLRYDWFTSFLKKKNSILLTAHHLDDSFETFLINLLRGTGLKGLTGIPNTKHQIHRPLLPFSKEVIKNYITENKIKYREDSSNSSHNYLRNKLRHNFIPELKTLTTNLDSKLSTLYTELNEIDNFIDQFILPTKIKLTNENRIKKDELNGLPQFMWTRLLSSFGVSRKNNEELKKLINDSSIGCIFQTSTHTLLNDREYLIISKIESNHLLIHHVINDDLENISLKEYAFNFEVITDLNKVKYSKNLAFLDYDKISFPLTIRNWQEGDKIQPLGMHGRKLISDILINKKINLFEKKKQTLIESKNDVIWLTNLVVSNQFAITEKTKKVLKIEHTQY